jgi:hypothetical protein
MTEEPEKTDAEQASAPATRSGAYTPPSLTVVGSVHALTLHRCWWGKKWGGVDGLEFMNIQIPVSSC